MRPLSTDGAILMWVFLYSGQHPWIALNKNCGISWPCNVSGPMVRHRQLVKHSMFTVFLFYKEKERLTGKGCAGVVIPWQLCRTIGPLTLQEIVFGYLLAQAEYAKLFWASPDISSFSPKIWLNSTTASAKFENVRRVWRISHTLAQVAHRATKKLSNTGKD